MCWHSGEISRREVLTPMNNLVHSYIDFLKREHLESHRVDLKSAHGVVDSVDCLQFDLSTPFMSRYASIAFTLHRTACRSL